MMYPAHYNEHLKLAQDLGLENPEGRALYACNRQQCGGAKWAYGTLYSLKETMVRCKPETATRWLAHFRKGGSIRSLQHTRESWNAKQRQDRAQPWPELK